MKEKTLACLFSLLFLMFLPLTVSSQENNYSTIPLNQHTLGIVDRCDKIVMKGFQQRKRGEKIEGDPSTLDIKEIEFRFVDGSNGFIMVFVRDKDNPQMASKNCIGFIGKSSNLIAQSIFQNRETNGFVIIVCKKGDMPFAEFYVRIGTDYKEELKSDEYLITRVDFYEKGSDTPTWENVFMLKEDYSVNLLKYFMEGVVSKFE